MDKKALVNSLARDRVVDRVIDRLIPDAATRADMVQEVYIAILNYDDAVLSDVIANGKIEGLIYAIARNAYTNKTSHFYKQYRRRHESIDKVRY